MTRTPAEDLRLHHLRRTLLRYQRWRRLARAVPVSWVAENDNGVDSLCPLGERNEVRPTAADAQQEARGVRS
jgi:hypothetical protein